MYELAAHQKQNVDLVNAFVSLSKTFESNLWGNVLHATGQRSKNFDY